MSMGFQDYLKLQMFNPFSLLPFFLFLFFLYKSFLSTKLSGLRGNISPPSPPKLPILGNLHQLGNLPHRALRSLSQKYGDLMLLHIGNKPTLVVSSANAAREIMNTHDVAFSNRPQQRAASRIFYGCKDMLFSQYGEYWRQIKSICVLQLLSNKKVRSYREIREEEVALMVEKLKDGSPSIVNLSEIIMTITNDIVCSVTFGKKYSDDVGGVDFRELFKELVEVLGLVRIGDSIPWLGWIDRVNGFYERVEKVANDLDTFLEKVISERQDVMKRKEYCAAEANQGENMKKFVDALLEVQMENKEALSKDSIEAVILDLFSAGTETTYTLLVWAMVELLRCPRAMNQVQQEVREIVRGKSKVSEDDLDKMSYLKATIKETLRLHPPAPLLVCRESSQDVKLNGYNIAAKTQVIVNAWAIQRDPILWSEPEEFQPERFLNCSVDFKGQNFEFIPFGAGRRGCPGISFTIVEAELILATLTFEFEWKIPDKMEDETLDMGETIGITVRKKKPLMIIATPYSYK